MVTRLPHGTPRAIYGAGSLLLSWLLMQAVHEAGHVVAGWMVDDRVEKLVLHPLAISRTDLVPGNNPLLTTAAGPVVGVVVPLLVWALSVVINSPIRHWLRFFAGFCLIANGAYLGWAMIEPVGDADVLVRHGAPVWSLGLFGLIAAPVGLYLWNGLGPQFGWGPTAREITAREAASVMAALILVIVAEMLLSSPR
jgi:hypothetical protein